MLAGTLLALIVAAGSGDAATAPSPTPTPVSSKPRTLADVARENKARGEKKAGTFSVAGGGEVDPVPEEPSKGRASAASTSTPGGATGGDEAYWRGRAQKLREELESARREEAEGDARLREALTKARNSEEMAKFADEIRRQATICRIRAESARKQLDALPEEARRAGASPGWIR
jgi:hypothetical protein